MGMTTTATTDKASEQLAVLDAAIAEVRSSADFQAVLAVAARFHRYSLGNCILIAAQRPDATRVAGFHAWRAFGRHVVKGAHSIKILAPIIRKVEDEDGERRARPVGFTIAHVFDVSDTDGDPLPSVPLPATVGDAPVGWQAAAKAFGAEHGFTVTYDDDSLGDAYGRTNFKDRTVRIRRHDSDGQAWATTVHELAHMLLHDPENAGRPDTYAVCEVEAEATAWQVATTFGVEHLDAAAVYLAGWAPAGVEQVRSVGDRVIATARTIARAFGAVLED